MKTKGYCAADGCNSQIRAKNLCARHYAAHLRDIQHGAERARRGERAQRGQSPLEWLHAHAKHKGPDCLLWPFGDARVSIGGRSMRGRRAMCLITHGAPGPGEQVGATHGAEVCPPDCVHPGHLAWVPRTIRLREVTTHRSVGTVNLRLTRAEWHELLDRLVLHSPDEVFDQLRAEQATTRERNKRRRRAARARADALSPAPRIVQGQAQPLPRAIPERVNPMDAVRAACDRLVSDTLARDGTARRWPLAPLVDAIAPHAPGTAADRATTARGALVRVGERLGLPLRVVGDWLLMDK